MPQGLSKGKTVDRRHFQQGAVGASKRGKHGGGDHRQDHQQGDKQRDGGVGDDKICDQNKRSDGCAAHNGQKGLHQNAYGRKEVHARTECHTEDKTAAVAAEDAQKRQRGRFPHRARAKQGDKAPKNGEGGGQDDLLCHQHCRDLPDCDPEGEGGEHGKVLLTARHSRSPKEEISYDDFAKLQFQVGEIIACEAVPKSKKLLCSQVRIGSQVKQIVSGIKAHYSPEEMVGKKVMVLVNLKPAKLAGVLSEGMLLCAEDAEGNLSLMTPEKDMPAGAEIA